MILSAVNVNFYSLRQLKRAKSSRKMHFDNSYRKLVHFSYSAIGTSFVTFTNNATDCLSLFRVLKLKPLTSINFARMTINKKNSHTRLTLSFVTS